MDLDPDLFGFTPTAPPFVEKGDIVTISWADQVAGRRVIWADQVAGRRFLVTRVLKDGEWSWTADLLADPGD